MASAVNQQRYPPRPVVANMSDAPVIHPVIHRELVELWTDTFGEPPPVVHDPPLMLALVQAALAVRRRRPSGLDS